MAMAFLNCGRLSGKHVLSSFKKMPVTLARVNYAQMAAGAPKLTFKPYEEPKTEHHDIRNARLNRPMSPHLTIYAPQLTSMLSITHRMTGMALSVYASALGIGALFASNDISHYVTIIEGLNLSPATLILAKAVLAFPFSYHLVNGVRHLYWDTAKGLTIKEVYQTGYFMLAGSSILTLILALL